MDKFPHVVDKQIRDLLEYGWNGDEDDICQALHKTRMAYNEDIHNQDIPFDVLGHRGQAIDDAEGWWNDEGNGFRAADELRNFWKV